MAFTSFYLQMKTTIAVYDIWLFLKHNLLYVETRIISKSHNSDDPVSVKTIFTFKISQVILF